MSSKQLKKIIGIVVGLLAVVGVIIYALFFFDTSSVSTGGNTEQLKASGGYETMKAELVSTLHIKESAAARIADIFWDDIGIKKYESFSTEGRRGTATFTCDGYRFDAFIRAGELANCYIGNVVVYKNPKVASSTVANAPEVAFAQYDTIVRSFTRKLGIEEQEGKDLYEKMTMMDINSFTDVKSGKLNGVKGYYGYEGNLKYFITVSGSTLQKVYVVCDGFEALEVYNGGASAPYKLSDVKITGGSRNTYANMAAKVKRASELVVSFPPAMPSGDDSWLMVRKNGEVYMEVVGEITVSAEKKKTEDFVIKLNESKEITYLKVGRKEYVK